RSGGGARGGRRPEGSVLLMTSPTEELREQVRAKYAQSARAVAGEGDGCGCGSGTCCEGDTEGGKFGEALYAAEQRDELPGAAVLASLGCGNPTAGAAYGLDMTDEMLALARRNARDAGVTNVHFLKGLIEQIPLPADSVDVVISNCVINLSTDKAAVLAEISRVLRPGGRLGVSDIVAEDRLSAGERAERGSYVGCIAGALAKAEYEAGLEAAGFEQVTVEFTHEVADGMHGAIVKAVKTATPAARGLPVVMPSPRAGCC